MFYKLALIINCEDIGLTDHWCLTKVIDGNTFDQCQLISVIDKEYCYYSLFKDCDNFNQVKSIVERSGLFPSIYTVNGKIEELTEFLKVQYSFLSEKCKSIESEDDLIDFIGDSFDALKPVVVITGNYKLHNDWVRYCYLQLSDKAIETLKLCEFSFVSANEIHK